MHAAVFGAVVSIVPWELASSHATMQQDVKGLDRARHVENDTSKGAYLDQFSFVIDDQTVVAGATFVVSQTRHPVHPKRETQPRHV